ncbi:MAG: diguanylate cyclase [Betaproteobacteria bacterium]|nr:diguanylate cyclase [Betaproteobacteria bacterium]
MRFAMLRILKRLGLAAIQAEDGLQALALFESEKPDLVLIDVQMPGMDGLEVVRRIRQMSTDHWVPVIFLTSMEDDADFARGIEAGGDDYLTKPVSPVVLEAKIRALRRLDDIRRELMAVTLELREANERLARLSQQDGLTGLANRRRFDLDLMRELGRARREQRPICLVIADADHFKAYNDAYGHPAGDECLRRIAGALRLACRRPGDVAARYGGEEFALILPDTTEEAGRRRAREAMRAVAALEIEHRGSEVSGVVTLSLGVAGCVPDAAVVADTLLSRADQALYAAKRAGRNAVIAFSDLPLPEVPQAVVPDLGDAASPGALLH